MESLTAKEENQEGKGGISLGGGVLDVQLLEMVFKYI